MTQAVKPLIR